MPPLLPELILIISEFLQGYKPAQLKLAALDSQCYRMILPSVYSCVELSSSGAILLFCHSVSNHRKQLGAHVKFIRLESRCLGVSQDQSIMIRALRTILSRLANLIELELVYHTDLFLRHPPVSGSDAPFHIERFRAIQYSGQSFTAFLKEQKRLRNLELIEPCCTRFDGLICAAAKEPSFLPELTELSSNFRHAVALIPNRPVKKAVINLPIFWNESEDGESLVSALCQSNGPLISLSLHSRSSVNSLPWHWVVLMADTNMAESLQELIISITIKNFNESKETDWKDRAESCNGFSSLRSIRIRNSLNQELQLPWMKMGRLGRLASWTACCSSLVSVEVMGVPLR